MWRKVGKVLLVIAIWAVIVAYVVYAALVVRRHKLQQVVERVEVSIVDSTHLGNLITEQKVLDMLLERGWVAIDTRVEDVPKSEIKNMICSEGFVDGVNIYASYNGTLHIDISQRKPLFRVVTGGYNSYITADGYIFRSPEHAALIVPVVSGTYTPPFDANYQGDIAQVVESVRVAAIDSVALIGKEKEPVYARIEHWKHCREEVRDSTVDNKKLRRRLYDYVDGHLRDCNRELEAIASRQQAVARRFESFKGRVNEFMAFVSLIERISSDRFWRAEVVQIVANVADSGSLWVELIPRSGNHTIIFGRVESVEQKFKLLGLYYEQVATTSGWDSYKSVNVSCAERIICTYDEK